jgi:glucokinase
MSDTPHAPVVGIDLGGTNTLVCVMDTSGQLVARTHRPTDAQRGADAVIDSIAEATREVCTNADLDLNAIESVGIAVCGAVDHAAGIVLDTGALDWKNVPLSAMLRERLNRPVVLENDVNAAAWGEYRRGAGREADGLLAAWVGTGIGGGIVLDGKLYHGSKGTAGELGQMMADTTGSEPRILEDLASRNGMRTLAAELAPAHPDSTLLAAVNGQYEHIGTSELAESFAADDPLTVNVVTTAARILGSALANAVTMLSIDTVVVGGGMTEALGPRWLEQISTQFKSDVFPSQAAQWCRILSTELESEAGLVGAAMIAADHAAASST